MKIFPNESLYIQFIRAFCNKEVSRRLYFNSSNRYWYGCVRALYNNLLPITPCIYVDRTRLIQHDRCRVFIMWARVVSKHTSVSMRDYDFILDIFFCTSRDWYSNQHPHCQSLFPMKSYIVKVSPHESLKLWCSSSNKLQMYIFNAIIIGAIDKTVNLWTMRIYE